MTVGAVIDHLLVAMDPEHRRVGELWSDLRTLLPSDFRGPLSRGVLRDEMGSRSFVTTEKDVRIVIFVSPDDRTVMMVATAPSSHANRLGEASPSL